MIRSKCKRPSVSWRLVMLCAVRGVWGLAELASPGAVFGRLSGLPLESQEVPVVRVLGARQVTQAVVSAVYPTTTVVALGVGVDGLHSLSMVGAGLAFPQYRRHALISAALAAGFGLAGWSAVHRSP